MDTLANRRNEGLLSPNAIKLETHVEEEVANCSLIGSQTQKGIASFALSANSQRPLAGTLNAAIFNTWRRFSHQVLYFAPPLVIAYVTMNWAIERYDITIRFITPPFADTPQKRVLELQAGPP